MLAVESFFATLLISCVTVSTSVSRDNSVDQIHDWQPVNGSRDKFFVYSAFFDDRVVRKVQVIGATRTDGYERVLCKLIYNGFRTLTIPAVHKVIMENKNLKYSACFVNCEIGNAPVPDYVSIVIENSLRVIPGNHLKVLNHPHDRTETPRNKLAVCVRPMFSNGPKLANLIEFVEFYRILGVEHFLFYNHSKNENNEIACPLNQYIDEGIVTLNNWNFELVSYRDIHQDGQLAAMNDCLLRTMYKFEYVVMLDFDEFLLPHTHDYLPDMFDSLRAQNHSIGAYLFQNAFFFLEWPNDASDSGVNMNLVTLTKTQRKSSLEQHGYRSKMMVIPRDILEVGIHSIWQFAPGRGSHHVAPHIGLSHHYRSCYPVDMSCTNNPSTVDRRAMFWRKPLTTAVKWRFDEFEARCNSQFNYSLKETTI